MNRLAYCLHSPSIEGEIVPELQAFFARVRTVRAHLGRRPYLNRIQRNRCRANLLYLESLEREFRAIDYREDFRHLHRRIRRYLYLNSRDLAWVLGRESVQNCSLFLP